MNKHKYLSLAAIILILLGIYILWFEKPFTSNPSNSLIANDSLFADSIRKISFYYPEDLPDFTITKIDKDKWEVIFGKKDDGDSISIRSFIDSLKNIPVYRTLSATEALNEATYGLDSPRFLLTVQGKSTTQYRVGNITPDGAYFYLKQSKKSDIYLISTQQIEKWFRKPDDFRLRNLTDGQVQDIQELQITNPHGTLILSRDGNQWIEKSKPDYILDSYEIDEILWKLVSGQIRNFGSSVSTDNRKRKAQPKYRFSIKYSNGKILNFDLTNEDKTGSVDWIQSSDRRYILGVDSTITMPIKNLSIDQIRDKSIFSFKVDDIQKIERKGTNPLEINKRNSDWYISPSNHLCNYSSVENTLWSLNTASLYLFTQDKNLNNPVYGLSTPQLILSCMDNKGKLYKIMVGKETHDNKGYYAYSNRYKEVFIIHKSTMNILNFNRDDIEK